MKQPISLLTPEQVAELLGVTVGTLAVWRSTGLCQIPYVKIGRCVRYQPQAITDFINERIQLHTDLKQSEGI